MDRDGLLRLHDYFLQALDVAKPFHGIPWPENGEAEVLELSGVDLMIMQGMTTRHPTKEMRTRTDRALQRLLRLKAMVATLRRLDGMMLGGLGNGMEETPGRAPGHEMAGMIGSGIPITTAGTDLEMLRWRVWKRLLGLRMVGGLVDVELAL